MFFKAGLELFDNEVDVKYGFIFGLKKLLLRAILLTNKKKGGKTQNQAYIKGDLNLDDS